jgi:hypothetical protein
MMAGDAGAASQLREALGWLQTEQWRQPLPDIARLSSVQSGLHQLDAGAFHGSRGTLSRKGAAGAGRSDPSYALPLLQLLMKPQVSNLPQMLWSRA